MNKRTEKKIEQVAKDNLIGIDTLETRGNDADDFHTVSVWSLKAALAAAYEAGKADAEKGAKK